MQPPVEQSAALAIDRRIAPGGLGWRQFMLLHEWIATVGPPLFMKERGPERSALVADVTRTCWMHYTRMPAALATADDPIGEPLANADSS
jgi:hypothetical protein